MRMLVCTFVVRNTLVFSHVDQMSFSAFFKQMVRNLIRRRVLWRLIWFCTICRCLTKSIQALSGSIHATLVCFCCWWRFTTPLTILQSYRDVFLSSWIEPIQTEDNLSCDKWWHRQRDANAFIRDSRKFKYLNNDL